MQICIEKELFHTISQLISIATTIQNLKNDSKVENRIPVAIIMEDDAVGKVAANFAELVQLALDKSEDWEVFRFHHWDPPASSQPSNLKTRNHVYATTECKAPFGTAMYGMTLKGAELAMKGYNPRKFAVDHYREYSTRKESRIHCYQPSIFDLAKVASTRKNPKSIDKVVPDFSENLLLFQRVDSGLVPDCESEKLSKQCLAAEDITSSLNQSELRDKWVDSWKKEFASGHVNHGHTNVLKWTDAIGVDAQKIIR